MISYPNIDPVFIRIGPLAFRWYGLMYALSFISAVFLIRVTAARKKLKITQDEISDLMLYSAIGVILGGRLGYVFIYNPGFYFTHPAKVFAVWEGGMSFHGGLAGVIIAGALFCKRHHFSFYEVADVAVISVPVGLGLGRLGNFINGELYGRPTDVPWCMVFPQGGPACRHPSQLYQAGLEGVALFLILWTLSRKNLPRGVLFWSLVMFYGLFRFIVEFFREPDPQLGLLVGPFSMGQLLSLPMFLLGLIMVWIQYTKGRSEHPMSRPASS
ncbi:MAG TPA: prolipoprotein diacylglyceryl transferase [Candidatus Manganitrophaceae bacterium]|nr:prolipoprotein diacylglyceryl transferase [Candidatus Manganitrophaceae bacterium]